MPPEGIKQQVFGGALFCLGTLTALLSGIMGFELDIFYVVISIIGAMLFLYGGLQGKRSGLTIKSQMMHPAAEGQPGITNCGADTSPPHSQI